MVRTAAILPTPGDPFVARYWLRNYERVWKGEVDRLVVLVNGRDPWEASRLFGEAGADVQTVDRRIGHGEALRILTDVDADVLMFCEDDAYVRDPMAVREALALAHEGIITASPRGGMHPILEQAARDKWGDVTGPDGSTGHGMWPCFLFLRRDQIMATTRQFEARFWGPGSVIPGLGYRVGSDALDTDTNTAVAFQLRDQFPIRLAGQWKEVHQKATMPADAPWFHAGGLSTLDEPIPAGLSGTNAGRDFAHRLWWWSWISLGDDHRRAKVFDKMRAADLGRDFIAWDEILPGAITWDDAA